MDLKRYPYFNIAVFRLHHKMDRHTLHNVKTLWSIHYIICQVNQEVEPAATNPWKSFPP